MIGEAMPGGLNPYAQYHQTQRLGYGAPGQMGAYGGGMGYGGGYGRMANTEGAVTGPVGSSSGSNPQAFEEGKQQMLAQQERQQGVNADLGAYRQGTAAVAAADQVKSIADYRQARDTGIGRDNLNTSAAQRTQATQLGIDPSSDAATIASAASGKTGFGANGMPTGAGTAQALPANSQDVAVAAAAAQNAKDGAAAAAQGSAYAKGYNGALGQQPTGANAYTAGITPHAVQQNDPAQADAQRKAVAMGVPPAPPPPSPNANAMTLRPMAGVPAQAATQPPQQLPMPPVRTVAAPAIPKTAQVGAFPTQPGVQRPIAPVTGRMTSLRPPFPSMSIPRSPALGTGPSAPPMSRRPRPTMAGSTSAYQ